MFFPEIENAMEHIAELEEKLKQLDNTEKCPCCNALVRKGTLSAANVEQLFIRKRRQQRKIMQML